MAANATSVKSRFRMECNVICNIKAPASKMWQLLTDITGFIRWNSTIKNMEGTIATGNIVKVEAKSSPGRIFRLKVSSVTPGHSMVWEDGFAPMFRGVRTYTLQEKKDGTTDFIMNEVFSGIMLPLIKGSLPDFVPIFEQYANDLKQEAEKN